MTQSVPRKRAERAQRPGTSKTEACTGPTSKESQNNSLQDATDKAHHLSCLLFADYKKAHLDAEYKAAGLFRGLD